MSYKTTAKQIGRDIETLDAKIASWQRRAMEAVKAGDDDLAKQALVEKKRCEVERQQLVRDRNEAASYAVELNDSRKQVEQRLRMLKLKKGTMAQHIAAARSEGDPFGGSALFDKMARAEQAIEEQAVEAEISQMLGDDGDAGAAADQVRRSTDALEADAQLAALKAKMADAGAARRLAAQGESDDDSA